MSPSRGPPPVSAPRLWPYNTSGVELSHVVLQPERCNYKYSSGDSAVHLATVSPDSSAAIAKGHIPVQRLSLPWIPGLCILAAKHPRTSRSQVFLRLPFGLTLIGLAVLPYWVALRFSFAISAILSHLPGARDFLAVNLFAVPWRFSLDLLAEIGNSLHDLQVKLTTGGSHGRLRIPPVRSHDQRPLACFTQV